MNAVENEALIEVLKHVCLNYTADFDYVITIMANCPGHGTDVDKAIEMIENNPDLNEIRSFDYEGNETGLMVFNKKTYARVRFQATLVQSQQMDLNYITKLILMGDNLTRTQMSILQIVT